MYMIRYSCNGTYIRKGTNSKSGEVVVLDHAKGAEDLLGAVGLIHGAARAGAHTLLRVPAPGKNSAGFAWEEVCLGRFGLGLVGLVWVWFGLVGWLEGGEAPWLRWPEALQCRMGRIHSQATRNRGRSFPKPPRRSAGRTCGVPCRSAWRAWQPGNGWLEGGEDICRPCVR